MKREESIKSYQCERSRGPSACQESCRLSHNLHIDRRTSSHDRRSCNVSRELEQCVWSMIDESKTAFYTWDKGA